jgi:hypothetical protein
MIIVSSTPWIGKWNSIQKSQCIWKLVNIKIKNIIKMLGIRIREVSDFIYLGLPIGDTLAKNSFLEKKMSKVERAFYSLYGIGGQPHALNPKKIAFLYKKFCQSIFRYGLDSGRESVGEFRFAKYARI